MEKSVILVGNAGSISGKNLGYKIDQFDEIIRINRFKTIGWEKDAGLKTTIWAVYNPLKGMNNFIRDYTFYKKTQEEIRNIVKDINEVWYISWKLENIMNDWKNREPLEFLDIADKVKRHQSYVDAKRIRRLIKNEPSTGFIVLNVLCSIYDKIYIIGFNLYEEPLYNHYFGGGINKNVQENPLNPHKLNKEYEVIKNLIGKNKIEFLSDNTVIKKHKFIGDLDKVRICKRCGATSVLYDWEQRICHICEENI